MRVSDLDHYYLDWETVETVLGGMAAIDIPRLNTPDYASAQSFLNNYGYNPDDPNHAQEMQRLRQDAIAFIERFLMQDPDQPTARLVMPPEVREQTDPRMLMIWASSERSATGRWSCSLLRVMHTFTHVSNDLAGHFFPAIQKQILDRVLGLVHTSSAGDVYLGRNENGLRLYMLDIKSQKSQDSLVLKMLHKPENVSSFIFDRMGFRFVTYTRLEALLALKYLKEELFAFPNVITPRSRNTLIQIPRYHEMLDGLRPEAQEATAHPSEMMRKVSDLVDRPEMKIVEEPGVPREHNVYSSTEYSSLQVTCRQLVRVKGPPIAPMMGRRSPDGLIEYKFYFPYEIQILDRASYVESRRGRSSHAEYKRAQLRAVRARIFPWLEREKG